MGDLVHFPKPYRKRILARRIEVWYVLAEDRYILCAGTKLNPLEFLFICCL